jgi:adenosylcobinamide kinase / adenosylcobinamide-phosphate guanylyltransferase
VSLTFLLGGARSGKSRLAVELAQAWPGPVTAIVTGQARDREMAERIRLHRLARPAAWHTIEEPLDVEASLAGVEPESAVILDCLSLWVANLMERGDDDDAVESRSEAAVRLVTERESPTIAVSNEVGLGVVPVSELGRRYRDLLGRVNSQWAAAAEEAAFVVAGRRLTLR